jgi:hypothetical protein
MASFLCWGTSIRRWLLLLGAPAAIVACGGDTAAGGANANGGAGGAGCPPGSEGCACYGNGTCNQPFTCASRLCVNLGTGGSVGLGGSGFYVSRTGGAPGVGGSAAGGLRVGGAPGFTGGRYSLGGFPAFTGGVPPTPTGGRATGGSNNPAGCPATQPGNRTSCVQGTGFCTYGTQQCQCGQFYSTDYQWTCGTAPPATGGTGAGGRSTGGRATGGTPAAGGKAGGTAGMAGDAGGTAGTPAAGGTAGSSGATGGSASGGLPTGGTSNGGLPSGGAGTAGSPAACLPGETCSTGYTCAPSGGAFCICVGTTLTCVDGQGGASGVGGAPPSGGVSGNAGAGGAATDCAVGLPCGADLSTCAQDSGDGGSAYTCYCLNGAYIVCI